MRHDPKCPQGHRFLIQFPGIECVEDAHAELAKIFPGAANDALFIPGCHVPVSMEEPYKWHDVDYGWRVYVPVKGEHA